MHMVRGYALPGKGAAMDYAGFGELRGFGSGPTVTGVRPVDRADGRIRVGGGAPRVPSAHVTVRPAHLPVIGQAQQGSLPYSAQLYAQQVARGLAPDPAAAVPALNGLSEIVALGAARMFEYGDEDIVGADEQLPREAEIQALLAKAEEVAASSGAVKARAAITGQVTGSSNLVFWGAAAFLAWRLLK